MIHEEIVTCEVAKLARMKGFPQDPNENGKCRIYTLDKSKNTYALCDWTVWISAPWASEVIAAPTQSLLQRWLRDEKDIHISVIANREENDDFVWYSNEVLKDTGWSVCSWWERPMTVCYSSYEQALEQAIKFALENLA